MAKRDVDFAALRKNRLIVNSAKDWDAAMHQLKEHIGQTNVIGFDCEWVGFNNWRMHEKHNLHVDPLTHPDPVERIRLLNARREVVTLMQLCANDGFTVLVRLVFFEAAPVSMKAFLADGTILKVGVNIYEDCSRLYKDWGILVHGWIDLRNICINMPGFLTESDGSDIVKIGLKALGDRFCEDFVEFDQKMRYSNWCARNLNESQLHYAAQDASMAVRIIVRMAQTYFDLSTTSTLSSAFWQELNDGMQGFINLKHDADKFQSKLNGGDAKSKTKEVVEDSDSDLDMDWNLMAQAASNRKVVYFEKRNIGDIKNRADVAGVSPLLIQAFAGDQGIAKIETDTKKYKVEFKIEKVTKGGK